jgi:hypothetical protein
VQRATVLRAVNQRQDRPVGFVTLCADLAQHNAKTGIKVKRWTMEECTVRWNVAKEVVSLVVIIILMIFALLIFRMAFEKVEIIEIFLWVFILLGITGLIRKLFFYPVTTTFDKLNDLVIQQFRPRFIGRTKLFQLNRFTCVKSYIKQGGRWTVHSLVITTATENEELLLLQMTPSTAFRYLHNSFDLPEFKRLRHNISSITGLKDAGFCGVLVSNCKRVMPG